MSALPPKADIVEHDCDVRFVPKADIARLPIEAIRAASTSIGWAVYSEMNAKVAICQKPPVDRAIQTVVEASSKGAK